MSTQTHPHQTGVQLIIFNYGIARSGTILANAIIRQLLSRRNWAFKNINIPDDPKILANYVGTLMHEEAYRYSNTILHGHIWSSALDNTLAQDPNLRAIVSYRDLRDVAVSLMRLHERSLEHSGGMAKAMAKNLLPLINSPHSLSLRYEISVQDRVVLTDRIAQHLGLIALPEELWEISEETSSDKHKAVMESLREGKPTVMVRKNKSRKLLVDRKTKINDRHIQSGTQGRWREELSEKDQEFLTELLAPELQQLGYPVD